MAGVAYGSLPFQQQISFFRNKRNVLTESWVDVWESQHDNAFMVAGANRAELVADFHEAVRKAIDDGATLEQFRTDFDRIVARHGWDYNGGRNWRSRVIYETNLRQSYNAGRWTQFQRMKKARPYLRYRHNDAVQHPRPVHVSWDKKIWHIDDPVWQVIHPMNGWGCQCYTEALSERDMKRLGKSGPDPSPQLEWKDVIVGQRSASGPRVVRTVDGVDPGFAYGPGQSLDTWPAPRRGGPVTPPSMQRTLERSAQDVLQKTTRLPADTASKLAGEALALQRAQDALQAGFAEFQATAIAAGEARNASYFVGALDTALVTALKAQGMDPRTAAIVASDTRVQGALRDASSGLSAATLARLPSMLRDPAAVLLDRRDGSLVYVIEAATRDTAATVVVVDTGTANAFRTATHRQLADVARELANGRLVLVKGAMP